MQQILEKAIFALKHSILDAELVYTVTSKV